MLLSSVSVTVIIGFASSVVAQQTEVGAPGRSLTAGTITTTTGTITNGATGTGVQVNPGTAAVVTATGAVIDRSTTANTAALEINTLGNDVSSLTVNLTSGTNIRGSRSAVGVATSQRRPVTLNVSNSTFATVSQAGAAIDASSAGALTIESVGNTIRAGAVGISASGGGTSERAVVVNSTGGAIDAQDYGIIAQGLGSGSVTIGQGQGITTPISLAPAPIFTASGIWAIARDTGAINVRTGAGGTIDGGSTGIETTATTGLTTIDIGAAIGESVAPTGNGVIAVTEGGGVRINNTAAITAGFNAIAARVVGRLGLAGDITVSSSANLTARQPVIMAITNAGTGAINYSLTGANTVRSTSTGPAILASSATGGINIGSAIDSTIVSPGQAVVATSRGGAININLAGVTTGSVAATVEVGAGSINLSTAALSSTGAAPAISATTTSGAVVVNANGNVTSSSGTGINVASGSTALVTIGAGTTTSGAVNGINSTTFGGSTIMNAGVIRSTGGFAIEANGGAASITNTGILIGRIDLTGNADTFANNAAGRFTAVGTSDFGLGNDSFNNAGVLTAFSSATFNGLENYTNTGLIELRDGVADDLLTFTGTTFTGGPGSQLGLDVSFATNSADRLVIGTAAGSTTLRLNGVAPGTAPLLNLDGILVVDANSAAASNFQLGGVTDFGFTRLNLVFDAATSNFRVLTVPDTEVFETGHYGVGMSNAWNQSGDAWSARMTELRDVVFTGLEERPDGFEMWAQGYAGSEGQNQVRSFDFGGAQTTFDLSYDQEFQGFQFGGDVQRSMGRATLVFGLTGGVINSVQEFASGNAFKLEGGNLGAYAGLYASGFFLNGLAKADRYEATVFSSTAFFREETEATTIGAKAEAGYRIGSGGLFVEPVVTLAYTASDLDDLSVPGGTFTFEDDQSLRSETGARIGGDLATGSSRIQPFIGVFAVQQFEGQNTVVFNSGLTAVRVENVEPDTYGKVSVGFNLLEQNGVNLFIRGDAAFAGEADGGSVRIAARWSF